MNAVTDLSDVLQVQYKFSSCIMGPSGYVIPRLVVG